MPTLHGRGAESKASNAPPGRKPLHSAKCSVMIKEGGEAAGLGLISGTALQSIVYSPNILIRLTLLSGARCAGTARQGIVQVRRSEHGNLVWRHRASWIPAQRQPPPHAGSATTSAGGVGRPRA